MAPPARAEAIPPAIAPNIDRKSGSAGMPRPSSYAVISLKKKIEKIRLDGTRDFYASPVAAGGRIYLVDREGVSLVLKQSTKVEVLATNRLADAIDASPAVAGRQLFLRGHKYLYCIEAP